MSKYERSYLDKLVQAAQAGDGNAFGELYAASYQAIYQKSYVLLGKEYWAQDAFFETFLKVHQTIGSLENPQDYFRWIEEIALESVNAIGKKHGLPQAYSLEPKNRLQKVTTMSLEIAEQFLEYIFLTEDAMPNSVPLRTLIIYQQYRTNRFTLQKGILGIVFLMFLSIPYWLLSPDLSITKTTANGYYAYRVDVDGWLDVSRVTGEINGTSVPITQDKNRSYIIYPTTEGELDITVTYVNHAKSTQVLNVENYGKVAEQN